MTDNLQSLAVTIDSLDSFFWIGANILVLYIAIGLVVFLTGYALLFDPRATTAGKFVYRFMLSLFGVVILVFISLWLDPSPGRAWYEYPGDVLWWRPAFRFFVYLGVAYTITALAILLVIRRWFPDKLKTSLDRDLVKPRRDK